MMLTDGTGLSYERRAIQQWLHSHDTSPVTGALLEYKTLVPNYVLRSLIGGTNVME